MEYLKFERMMCNDLYRTWDKNISKGIYDEFLRKQILQRRIVCKNFWLRIGKKVPKHLEFSTE